MSYSEHSLATEMIRGELENLYLDGCQDRIINIISHENVFLPVYTRLLQRVKVRILTNVYRSVKNEMYGRFIAEGFK